MTFDPFANIPNPAQVADEQATNDDGEFNDFMQTLATAGWNPSEEESQPPPSEQPEEEQGEEEAEESEEPSVPTVAIGEREVPLSEVTALYELGKAIKDGNLIPQKQEPLSPAPERPTFTPSPLPEYIDQDNPVESGLWKELQSAREELFGVRQLVSEIQQTHNQDRTAQIVNEGIAQFRKQYPHLSDSELNQLRAIAAPLASSFVAISATPVEGVVRALYHAGIDSPATREKLLSPTSSSTKTSSETRKKKLGSLSPSGSAPRTGQSQARPNSDREAVNEFGRQLAESFHTNGRLN